MEYPGLTTSNDVSRIGYKQWRILDLSLTLNHYGMKRSLLPLLFFNCKCGIILNCLRKRY